MPGISSAAILLLVLGAVVPTAYGEPAVIPKDAKIVEGTDRVSGTGIDQTLAYMTPDSFYGPEALYLLFGTCFTELVERYEYTICPFENVTQKRLLGGKPTLLGVWGAWKKPDPTPTEDSAPILPFQVMEYGRGQTCGHSSRKVTVELVEADDFGILPESVLEKPTCTFFFKFGVPFSVDALTTDIIERPIVSQEEEVIVEAASTEANAHPLRAESPSKDKECLCSNTAISSGELIAAVDSISEKLSETLLQVQSLQQLASQLKSNATNTAMKKQL